MCEWGLDRPCWYLLELHRVYFRCFSIYNNNRMEPCLWKTGASCTTWQLFHDWTCNFKLLWFSYSWHFGKAKNHAHRYVSSVCGHVVAGICPGHLDFQKGFRSNLRAIILSSSTCETAEVSWELYKDYFSIRVMEVCTVLLSKFYQSNGGLLLCHYSICRVEQARAQFISKTLQFNFVARQSFSSDWTSRNDLHKMAISSILHRRKYGILHYSYYLIARIRFVARK